ENGFLEFKVEKPRTVMDMDGSSLAFALDPGRIYINTKDRFPNAITLASEKARIVADISAGLKALNNDGRPVVSRVVAKDEAFKGLYKELGPDLVVLANRGFDIKGLVSSETLFNRRVFTGMHTQNDAFIITSKDGFADINEPFHIEGIAGLVAGALS
ncbi:MAG: hypothetical protein HY880_06525, partial [Deltaproteobacteria bacterium]|nr:hypothetical protein [Deltaproteobacteria bacterium]